MPSPSRPSSILLLSLVVTGVALGGCTSDPTPAQRLGEPPAGALRGELATYTETRDDGTSNELYMLRSGERGTEEVPLLFDRDPDLSPGLHLDVWGTREGDGLRVHRFEVLRQEEITQALVNAPPFAPRSFVM